MRELIKGDDAVRFIEELLDSIDAYYEAINRSHPFKVETGIARSGGRTRKKQRLTRLQRRRRRQRR